MAAEATKTSKKALLVRLRARHKIMTDADQENRTKALEDLKFANEPGAQWDLNMKQERGSRPCYEFNRCRVNGKRVINEIRANRPQGKVRAVEGGDKDIAELYEGLIRNIWNISDGDTITDQAAEYQVDAGMAAWRVVTEYAADDVFDLDILVKPFKNPLCVYADPACQDVLKRDAEDWLVTERMSKDAFEARWPDAKKMSFEDVEFDDADEWEDDETVRVCEYWYKEPIEKELWLIRGPDGHTITVDSTTDEGKALAAQGVKPERARTVKTHKIMMCIASGDAILDGPVEWPGSRFPFVMIYGEYKVIDGKTEWWGLHRFAKDPQRSYNISRTAIDETIALAPQAKWWATVAQAKGHTDKWAEAHRQNFPFLLFNADPQQPGAPQRMGGADVPVALIQQATIASQDLRDVTGLHEASFGEEGGEKSGIALARKQAQASIVTYNFPDNIAKGIRLTWEILVDLIPNVYDAERELRIIGSDGAESYKRVNQIVQDPRTGQAIRVNDLTTGKYDVTVTTGPSFSTMRQEAATIYSDMASRDPNLTMVAGDLMFKAMDLPYADEIAKRYQTLLPPPIQQMISKDKPIPPEAQAAMAQAEQAMQQVQQTGQMVQAAAQEAEQKKAEAEKAQADVQTAIANLKTEEARFEARVAKAEAQIAQKLAQIAQTEGRDELQGEREQLTTEVQQAVAQIQAMAAEHFKATTATMAQIMANHQPQVVVPPARRIKSIQSRRVNGNLEAVPVYEDEQGMPMGMMNSPEQPGA
jgi:hypothetical protein